jgi:hypothetical protein
VCKHQCGSPSRAYKPLGGPTVISIETTSKIENR